MSARSPGRRRVSRRRLGAATTRTPHLGDAMKQTFGYEVTTAKGKSIVHAAGISTCKAALSSLSSAVLLAAPGSCGVLRREDPTTGELVGPVLTSVTKEGNVLVTRRGY